jgi:DNA modification methylase
MEFVHRSDRGSLIHADNLHALDILDDGCCDLIYIDPPFGTGRRRTTTRSKGYDDQLSHDVEQYVEWIEKRIHPIHRILKETGSLYVHLDWRSVHYVKIMLDQVFGIQNFLNEIVWHYRTGGLSKKWFGRKHDTILSYAKRKGAHTFNVIRGGKFRTDGLKVDDSGRPYKSTTRGRLYFNPEGPAMTDVWDIPFLSTVSNERTGYPTQKPLALIERIILASSNPGDTVADVFCGSGTTLVAAERLGRKWIGVDEQAEAIVITAKRLQIELDESPTTSSGNKSIPLQ